MSETRLTMRSALAKKPKPPVFDWKKVRSFISEIERVPMGGTLPNGREMHRYIKAQKFWRETTHVRDFAKCRDVVLTIAEEWSLSPHQAKALYLAIQRCSSRYGLHASMDRFANAPDATKELEKISFGLHRLAKFSSNVLADNVRPEFQIAERRVDTALHLWAKAHKDAGLPTKIQAQIAIEELGFAFQSFDDSAGRGEDFGALLVFKNWLRLNIIMNELVRQIVLKYRQPREDDGAGDPLDKESSTQWLAGYALPALYERFTKRKFGISRGTHNNTRNATGVRFVKMALAACGAPDLAPNTIASHRRKARQMRTERPVVVKRPRKMKQAHHY